MGIADRVWGALSAMVKLEDKVTRQAEAFKSQQAKIEQLTERVIRLETQLDLLITASRARRLKAE